MRNHHQPPTKGIVSARSRRHAERAVLLLMAAFLLCFASLPTKTAHALSIADETQMGREFVDKIRAHYEIMDDEFVNKFMNDLGQYLLSTLETRHFPFRFYVLKSDMVNAFAAPGGHIFFFSGLIEVMDTADELASIVCHEIGHISARHLSHRIEQSKKINYATLAAMLAGVLLGGAGPVAEALIIGSQAASMQAQLHYSRNDERQADQLGFKYIAPTGFKRTGLITALQKIQKGSYYGSNRIPSYLLTHPTGPERMANISSLVANASFRNPSPKAIHFGLQFPYFKSVVRARSMDPDDAMRSFEFDLKEDPHSPAANFGIGIVYTEMSEYGKAIEHLAFAYRRKPGFAPIITALGEAYQLNGNDQKALQVLNETLDREPTNKQALFLAGRSYQNMGACSMAVHFYERVTALPGYNKPDVYYQLGLCYGKENRLARAHYNFGLYFKELRQPPKAEFHFRKARELAVDDPVLQRKIEEAFGPKK
ncbi:MAG: M48 family metalloprotease [Deltaproteobacteria bacterium]|nr:M48 family metalloprotease [Deltaproteobacteria bacterium]